MTDIDIVAELRNCDYMAACGELNALGSGRSHLREVEKIVYLAEIAIPALLDAVEALRGLRRYPANTVSAEVYEMRLDAALAALKRSDEE